MKNYITCLILCAALLVGCTALQPGADPLVVRTEQSLTMGKSAFDLAVIIDHSNRDMWRTNTPAFHEFCEWLRAPQVVPELVTTLPRASAMLYSLDTIKKDYIMSKTSSNALYSALMTFESTMNQANSWLTIITNKL